MRDPGRRMDLDGRGELDDQAAGCESERLHLTCGERVDLRHRTVRFQGYDVAGLPKGRDDGTGRPAPRGDADDLRGVEMLEGGGSIRVEEDDLLADRIRNTEPAGRVTDRER